MAGNYAVNTTDCAWLVVHMCHQWIDRDRCYEEYGYLHSINCEAVIEANKIIPLDYEAFLKYEDGRSGRFIMRSGSRPDIETFNYARKFLTDAANSGDSIGVSH